MIISSPPAKRIHHFPIYDSQTNESETYLLTCGADRAIVVSSQEESSETYSVQEILRTHRSQIWENSWAPSCFGEIFASASYDSTVVIWKRHTIRGKFFSIFRKSLRSGSVNGISWAPKSAGLRVVTCCANGSLHEIVRKDENWISEKILDAHHEEVLCVQWLQYPVAVEKEIIYILASGGNDRKIKLWLYNSKNNLWKKLVSIECSDPVTDVAFDPLSTLKEEIFLAATCGKTLSLIRLQVPDLIDSLRSPNDAPVLFTRDIYKLENTLTKLSWSPVESILCVVTLDKQMKLYALCGGILRSLAE